MTFIEKYQSLSPTCHNWNTNHLPMVITALKQLGASDSVIEATAAQYVKEQPTPDLANKFYVQNDFEEQYINKTNMYNIQINEIGRDATIKEFFTFAQFSLASGLFHGLIRLYYAIIEDNDLLIAQALAYFELISSENLFQGTLKEDTSAFTELESFRKATPFTFKSNASMDKFKELGDVKQVRELLFTLRDISNKEDQILDLFLSQYIKTNDFYILHVVTGFHALASLKGYFASYEVVLEQFFLGTQVFMLFNDYQKLIDIPELSDLNELKNRVSELHDAHDIKLLFTIIDLFNQYKNEKLMQVGTMIFK